MGFPSETHFWSFSYSLLFFPLSSSQVFKTPQHQRKKNPNKASRKLKKQVRKGKRRKKKNNKGASYGPDEFIPSANHANTAGMGWGDCPQSLPWVLTGACASADGVDGGGDRGGGVEGQVAILTGQAFVLPAGGADADAGVPGGVLPPVEFVIRVLSLVIVVSLPVVQRVGAAAALATEAARRAVLQVVEPHGQGAPVLQGGGRVDQGVGQQLPALLDVLVVLDGVRQDFGQEFHVLDFRLDVAGLQ